MRKIALISDVHSNLEALQVVLAEVKGLPTYCLGDTVGYGASPNEVIQLLKKMGVAAILGNHDQAVLTGDTSYFNARAAISAKWTVKALTEESREYLKGLQQELKIEIDGSRLYMTHGSPDDHLWEYVFPASHSELFDFYLSRLSVGVIALGHTHVPYVWRGRNGVVLNPGSVGQPRTGDSRASYAVVTFGGQAVEVEPRLIEYDISAAARKIRMAGLPEEHAERLFDGM